MTTPSVDGSQQGSVHVVGDDIEVASAPAAMSGRLQQTAARSNPVPDRVSHDRQDHDDARSVATMGTMATTGTSKSRGEGASFLNMMQTFLQGTKSFDSADVSASEPVPAMQRAYLNNNGHSYNTLDSASSKQHEDFSDEQNKQNWLEGNAEGGQAADWGSVMTGGASINDPSLCSTPPRTRIDPEQGGSLDPPGTSARTPPRTAAGFNNFFRRPPPGPESSDDELKESLVMENQTQGWFGGLLNTPDRVKSKEMDTTLPETPPGKDDFTPVSSVESNGGDEDDEIIMGSKVASDKKTVKVRLIYFIVLFFFLLVIIGGLIFFLIYLSNLDKEQSNQVRDFVATMRPTGLATKAPSMAPTTATPTGSAAPTITAYPTKSPTPGPSAAPTKRPTRKPTAMPTKTPTNNPTIETPDIDFMKIMADLSPETAMKMEAPGSPHNRAFTWLINDPDYYNYNDERKITRWVLALVKLTLQIKGPDTVAPTQVPTTLTPTQTPTTPAPTRQPNDRPTAFFWNFTSTTGADPVDTSTSAAGGDGRRLNWNALESWMQYTDECQWFSSYWFNRVACNQLNQFKRITLINVGLEGTIPSEISLISRLDSIMLPLNQITGTIPSEVGSLRWLNTFNVSYNAMEGNLPRELADAPNLATLDVGNNMLTAPVPTDICQMGLRTFRGDCGALQCPCCSRCAFEG